MGVYDLCDANPKFQIPPCMCVNVCVCVTSQPDTVIQFTIIAWVLRILHFVFLFASIYFIPSSPTPFYSLVPPFIVYTHTRPPPCPSYLPTALNERSTPLNYAELLKYDNLRQIARPDEPVPSLKTSSGSLSRYWCGGDRGQVVAI